MSGRSFRYAVAIQGACSDQLTHAPITQREYPACRNGQYSLRWQPARFQSDSDDADTDGEWTFNSSSSNITHMRNDGTVHHWDYAVTGDNLDGDQSTGTLGERESGAGD